MRTSGLAFYALSFLLAATAAQAYCDGCSVVEEFGIGDIQPGYKYRLSSGAPVVVDRVDQASSKVLVTFVGSTQSDWIAADDIYTDQHAFELQQKTGLVASCAAYAAAMKDGNFILEYAFRGACCDSSAAKRYGTPPGAC